MANQSAVHELQTLVLSFHSLIAIETVEEERVRSIVGEVGRNLSLPMYDWSITSGLTRSLGVAIEGTTDPGILLRKIEDIHDNDAIYLLKDFTPHLNNPNVCRALRELTMRFMSTPTAIVITGDPIELPRDLDALAVRFDLQLPDPTEVREMVRNVVESMSARKRIRMDLSKDDAQRLVRALSGLTLSQVRQAIAKVIVDNNTLTAKDIDRVIRWKGEIIERGGLLEFYPLEGNQFELGGFARLKAWLENASVGFTAEARALNLSPPKGVMFVGVQGCGKSLAAKFIARSWSMPLLKLDAGRLYDKYVGESEKNFRKATSLAEAMAPVVLWIDEIEKAFAQGGTNDADGGLSQRLFASVLTWLQEKRKEVFVVGAANDLTRLPPELLRKGRFDEIFFVDLPNPGERKTIFQIHLVIRKQDPRRFDLDALSAASEGYSGAEIEQSIIAALYRCLRSKESLTTPALLSAVKATVPLSVTRREDIEELRHSASGRFTPVA
ncbi:MAG TPA: AAA family ATPase [Thermoanaerobaculia bacterium]|nr:AAA family ATPase [Thermoanaerobaculia bacterium]